MEQHRRRRALAEHNQGPAAPSGKTPPKNPKALVSTPAPLLSPEASEAHFSDFGSPSPIGARTRSARKDGSARS
eukprot:CAMPEP_0119270148 /NCGR_PEP_ID=MMETSP1329-20130426/7269_1 /TAXON_ID=114041 /ORGANISM="Genus nov. species nov., Strain RCC1024" /LENGTH=73 /DNA_ID=CAMNT_0007270157 /DNA_START=107 /DNA_END=325 /DNA_ORIENTATION=+